MLALLPRKYGKSLRNNFQNRLDLIYRTPLKLFLGYFYPLSQSHSSLSNFRQKLKLSHKKILNLNKAIYRSSLYTWKEILIEVWLL